MTKAELIEALEDFDDDADVEIQTQWAFKPIGLVCDEGMCVDGVDHLRKLAVLYPNYSLEREE